jgi:hypothetical protein
MKQALIFSSKVWLTTVVVTPLLATFVLGLFMRSSGDSEPIGDDIGFFLACVIFGLAYSLIPFLIMWYVAYRLNSMGWSVSKVKFTLMITAIVLSAIMFISFDLYRGFLDWNTLSLSLPYIAVLALSIWLYKLKPVSSNVDTQLKSSNTDML